MSANWSATTLKPEEVVTLVGPGVAGSAPSRFIKQKAFPQRKVNKVFIGVALKEILRKLHAVKWWTEFGANPREAGDGHTSPASRTFIVGNEPIIATN